MAKVKELTVGTGRKLGLPGYSSMDVSAFITIEMENGDDPQKVYKKAWATVEGQVIETIKSKGLDSPVADEVAYEGPPSEEWLSKESPSEQKSKINAAKRLKEVEKELKDSSAVKGPVVKGGEKVMPISNDVKVIPTTEGSGGPGVVIPDGIYDVQIGDITFIPGEQNQFSGKPQLKMSFKILAGEHKDVELRSWVSMSMNPGWEQGSPSHLYSITKAVMMEEPDLEADFYPNVLVGGKLRVFVEEKVSKKGTKYSKVAKYLAVSTTVEQDVVQEKELKTKKTEEQEAADSLAAGEKEVPF